MVYNTADEEAQERAQQYDYDSLEALVAQLIEDGNTEEEVRDVLLAQAYIETLKASGTEVADLPTYDDTREEAITELKRQDRFGKNEVVIKELREAATVETFI